MGKKLHCLKGVKTVEIGKGFVIDQIEYTGEYIAKREISRAEIRDIFGDNPNCLVMKMLGRIEELEHELEMMPKGYGDL